MVIFQRWVMVLSLIALTIAPSGAANDADYASAQPSEEGSEAPKPGTLEFARLQLKQKNYKGAETTYKALYLSGPYDPDVLLGIAFCERQLGDLDEAIKYARQASIAAPKSPETHIALGHYLEENRDLKAAYLQYSRALDLKPNDEQMTLIFVPTLRILLALDDMQVAVRLAHKWAHEFPENASCQYNNGWVLSQCGEEKKLPEAIASYETAVRLEPGLVGAHYNLALLHYKQGDNDAAVIELDQFIKLAPGDPDLKQAKALLAKLKGQSAITARTAPETGPLSKATSEPAKGLTAKPKTLP